MVLVTVTHYGRVDSIKEKQKNMKLPANHPIPNTKFARYIEDNRKVVWVRKGKAKPYDFLFTGMAGAKAKARVEFEIEEERLEYPNGKLKRFWGKKFQKVIVGDVEIPKDARFYFKN